MGSVILGVYRFLKNWKPPFQKSHIASTSWATPAPRSPPRVRRRKFCFALALCHIEKKTCLFLTTSWRAEPQRTSDPTRSPSGTAQQPAELGQGSGRERWHPRHLATLPTLSDMGLSPRPLMTGTGGYRAIP